MGDAGNDGNAIKAGNAGGDSVVSDARVEWVDEPVAGYPERAVPHRELGPRTLTNLYNERPQWLEDAHAALDGTVAAAYGWDADKSDDYALRKLLELNIAVNYSEQSTIVNPPRSNPLRPHGVPSNIPYALLISTIQKLSCHIRI